ncbi:MAG: hypothetical protein UY22_C0043G0015 [Candidatus Amesbacteria bacterium GW2011_GWC1_48_10]|nr:MAG: hypothetical protein UY22_C0043G0015 [Candidatus Amesbacteria bacterium GW2011_GWC1_48_10]
MADGSGLCISHNPAAKDIKQLAVRKGGEAPKKVEAAANLPTVTITTKADVPTFLVAVIDELRAGQVDIKTANTLGYLAGVLIKAYETAEMEARIEEIERVVLERRTRYGG